MASIRELNPNYLDFMNVKSARNLDRSYSES